MFGYVKVFKPELKIKDYETYKGVYCTLCKTLGKEYGFLARGILNYDFTFLALIHLAVQPRPLCFQKTRCEFHPLHLCQRCTNEGETFSFTAAASVLGAYYKAKDNIQDSGWFQSLVFRIVKRLLAPARRKASRRYPALEEAYQTMEREQQKVERAQNPAPDPAAHPTATLLAVLFAWGKEGTQRRVLERMGYCLGRYIYFMDALEDLEKDFSKQGYNPFLFEEGRPVETLEQARRRNPYFVEVINHSAGESARALELLDVYQYKDLLSNVLYLGLVQARQEVLEKAEEVV